MIRRVELQDAKAITTIYNEYVGHSVATFETEPLREEDMRNRIAGIAVRFPYFVYEEEGKVVGYCYAHLWKERAAYRQRWLKRWKLSNAIRRSFMTIQVLCRRRKKSI